MTVPAVLAPYVAWMVAYDTDLGAPGVHRGLPSTTVTLVFPAEEPIDVSWADESDRRASWSSLSGLDPRPAAIHHSGRQRGVQLALTIAGTRALFGMPAAPLAGQLLTLDEVDTGLRDLPERLAGADRPAWTSLVTTALTAELARLDVPGPRAEVGRALARLTGGAGVREVADEVGYSRRRLGDLVRAEAGVTPKEYQRIARFERTRQLVGRRPLAEIAAECGYADQAHLSREWRELAGCTPTTWLREEFPFVQERPADDGADSRHE